VTGRRTSGIGGQSSVNEKLAGFRPFLLTNY
jgi:hypothetical protein